MTPPGMNRASAESTPNEVLVRLKNDASTLSGEELPGEVLEEFNFSATQDNLSDQQLKILRMKIPSGSNLEETIEQLSEDPRVAYAEPNHIYRLEAAASHQLHIVL